MLWQRFGDGARDEDMQATAIISVEPKDLDPEDSSEGRKQKSGPGRNSPRPRFWTWQGGVLEGKEGGIL